MQTISTRQAKIQLPHLIERVQAGEEFLITCNGKPMATLSAFPESQKPQETPASTE